MRHRRLCSLSAFLTLVLLLAGACAGRTAPPAAAPGAPPAAAPAAKVPLPDSIVWFRTSVEYRAVTTQSYRLATLMLDRALADRTWTAALEQTGDYGTKPVLVVPARKGQVLNRKWAVGILGRRDPTGGLAIMGVV